MSTKPSIDLATKLDRLFESARRSRGAEFTYREVSDGIAKCGGARVSATYLWQLRTGLRANPSRKHIEGFAAFFGVPVNYFFDDDGSSSDAEPELAVALRRAPVRHIAVRLADLSDESLDAIAGLVEHLRRLEGLPADSGPTSA